MNKLRKLTCLLLASLGGELGQRQLAETVMGIIGGHGYHLMGNQFFSFYTNSPQKGSKIRKKFLYVLCKQAKRLLFGGERAIIQEKPSGGIPCRHGNYITKTAM